jgi:ketosteroid isomerase-like protein
MAAQETRPRLRKSRIIWLLVGLGLAAAAIPSPAAAQAAAGAGEEADHAALRQFKTLFEKAVNENQLELMRPHLDQPFSVVTYTDREFTDFDAFKARWQKTREELLEGGRYTLTLDPDRSQIFGDIAVAHGNSDNVLVTGGGQEHHFSSHWTVVFRKVDGQWKITRAHNSLNPFDNPMLRAGVRKIVIRFAVGAFVLGLILGWLIRTLWTRRQPRTLAPATP